MSEKSKQKEYDKIKKEAELFLKTLKGYPNKDISEFTRLKEALDNFINYGVWEEWNEDD